MNISITHRNFFHQKGKLALSVAGLNAFALIFQGWRSSHAVMVPSAPRPGPRTRPEIY